MADVKEPFKKLFFSLVGAAAVTAEKANEIVDELVKKGEITVEDGKKLAKEMQDKAEVAQKEYSQKVKKEVEATMGKFGYVKKEEMDALRKELEELRAQVNGEAKPKRTAKKPAAKKPAAKKKEDNE